MTALLVLQSVSGLDKCPGFDGVDTNIALKDRTIIVSRVMARHGRELSDR